MFAGASRALLTSIVFALETTGRTEALLPLLGACAASYLVSYFLMKNTIMTEKIARRGVRTPDSYQPDILEKVLVERVMNDGVPILSSTSSFTEAMATVGAGDEHAFVVDEANGFCGIVDLADLRADPTAAVGRAVRVPRAVRTSDDLRMAVAVMARTKSRALAVMDEGDKVVGLLTYAEVLRAYDEGMNEHVEADAHIVLKRRRLKMLVQSRRLLQRMTGG